MKRPKSLNMEIRRHKKCLETGETTTSLGHFLYSKDFVVFPVSRHFPYSRDFAYFAVSRNFPYQGTPNDLRWSLETAAGVTE